MAEIMANTNEKNKLINAAVWFKFFNTKITVIAPYATMLMIGQTNIIKNKLGEYVVEDPIIELPLAVPYIKNPLAVENIIVDKDIPHKLKVDPSSTIW